jgi:short-subunit dehydrogenase
MNKTVLITGASQGIGKETAQLFTLKGYNVVLAARNSETLNAVANEIKNIGRKALAIPTDISEIEQVKALVESAIATYGHIDVLVNNAGICMTAPMVNTSLDDWHKIIDINLWGYIHLIHVLLPHLLDRKTGTIVNVGSIGGVMPLPNMTAYCTSKYAIAGLTETLRLELEPKGIRVCAVHPSATDSDFLERAIFRGESEDDEQKQRQQMQQFLKSPLASQPKDVAKEIWNIVQYPKAETIVGSGNFPATIHRLLPGLTNWLLKRTTN